MLEGGDLLAQRYRIEQFLGASALGEVYRARDDANDDAVALYVLSADLCPDPYLRERLERKAQALARLQHPNILRLREVGQDGQLVYVVCDTLEATTLAARLRASAGPLAPDEMLSIAEQLCAGLHYAHARGVVHADLRPDNILIDRDGAALLAEVGLARTVQDSVPCERPLTPDPGYLSPEQCRDGTTDARSDLYALGVVLYEMVTGRSPFLGEEPSVPGATAEDKLRYQHLRLAPPPPRSLNPNLPEALDRVILRCLAKDPEARYQGAAGLAEALRAALPASASPEATFAARARLQRARSARRPASAASPAVAPGSTHAGQNARRWPRWAWRIPAAVALVLAGVLYARVRGADPEAPAPLRAVTRADFGLPADPAVLQLSPSLALPLVTVPTGDFLMGSVDSDIEPDPDELPQHLVYLDEYQIGRYEVTVAQWRAFVEGTGYAGAPGALVGLDDAPVRFVNWDDAAAFCTWASQLTGRNVHLPTEAQWEKAARGPDGRLYPWGDHQPTCAECSCFADESCQADATTVGSCSPNGDSQYGCSDMAGNVWEWTQDWYAPRYYTTSPADNPQGPETGLYRSLRGGSWLSNAWRVRAPRRFRGDPTFRCADLGFRVCVSPN